MEPQGELEQTIKAVRHFSRFYTAALGTLDEHLLRSPLSLAEARVLFEVANSAQPTATDLSGRLKLDPGYVSRILGKLEERGWIRRKPSAQDARQSEISLTGAGRKQFATLDQRSNDQVAGLLSTVGPEAQHTLVQAMASIEAILGTEPKPAAAIVLRSHRPGDMGWVTHRHGVLYAREYGFDGTFEVLVARIAADFLEQFDPQCERCWIAEREGQFLGSVFLVKDRGVEGTAKLRLLLVEPSARGLGLGRTLVRQCTQFAREAGYSRIVLWTNSVLTAARHIYEREGYVLQREEEHESFGRKMIGQYWELQL